MYLKRVEILVIPFSQFSSTRLKRAKINSSFVPATSNKQREPSYEVSSHNKAKRGRKRN